MARIKGGMNAKKKHNRVTTCRHVKILIVENAFFRLKRELASNKC